MQSVQSGMLIDERDFLYFYTFYSDGHDKVESEKLISLKYKERLKKQRNFASEHNDENSAKV